MSRITILIATLAVVCMSATASPWRIDDHTDAITDELTYYVYATGSDVRVMPSVSYRPNLVIRIHPKSLTPSGGLKYAADVMLSIENDGLTRNRTEITTRYDRQPATTELWSTSTDRRAAFAPDCKSTLSRLTTATNLIVRYETTLGHVRTTTFDVTGLTNALKTVKTKYLTCRK